MRNLYSPWEELASLPHIELRRESPGAGKLGEYIHHCALIRLDPRMPRRQARSVLCHELQHVRFEDVLTSDPFINARQEARADTNAARLLIDVADLGEALLVNDQRLITTAVDLRVSLDMLQVRLNGLTSRERTLLRELFWERDATYSF